METYDKKPQSVSDLVKLLIGRGLVADPAELEDILRTVGYFRLSGYLYPFRKPGEDGFREGTSLGELWGVYTFDRKLRLMAMDALARIEIAIRALVTEQHTAVVPDAFAYVEHGNLPEMKLRRHTELLNTVYKAMRNAKDEADLVHLKQQYGIEDYPPIWNVMEHAPFGVVTLYYEGLDASVKQKISNVFYVIPNAFSGILMTLKNARNICAHHSRFWNKHIRSRITRNLGVRPELKPLVECLDKQTSANYTSAFSVLSLCAYCLGILRPQNQWKTRCKALLHEATPFILRGMGVPENWEELALWKD